MIWEGKGFLKTPKNGKRNGWQVMNWGTGGKDGKGKELVGIVKDVMLHIIFFLTVHYS